jgi:hypothetical protein
MTTMGQGKNMAAPIKRVVSVCEARDIGVWKIASERIVRHIGAESYQLVCPDAQISLFREATHPAWDIFGEDAFTRDCTVSMIRQRVTGENICRVNWLFQQFVKINAIARSGLGDDDVVVIWDADTVPLRDMRFVENGTGRLLCYHGTEQHLPYFKTIDALLGFGRMAEVSLIAQCLPLKAGWLRELLAEIESRSGKPYAETVLACLPGESGAEFSEYETIGSWMLCRYPDEVVFREHNRWIRRGSSIFPRTLTGHVARVLFSVLSMRYDFVAIESWKAESAFRRLLGTLARRIG